MPSAAYRKEQWRRRLYIPNYRIGDAARYARIAPATVAAWHKGGRQTLSLKESGISLSYLQLIEVAVVAAFRKAGITLQNIRKTREYVSQEFGSDYPFAEYRFKQDGRRLVMSYTEVVGASGEGMVLRPDQGGQLAWELILGRLGEFDYEAQGVVITWHLSGRQSPVVIDPRIAFGAPSVLGTPTWVIKGRWVARESAQEIADDFGIDENAVHEALRFEGINTSA